MILKISSARNNSVQCVSFFVWFNYSKEKYHKENKLVQRFFLLSAISLNNGHIGERPIHTVKYLLLKFILSRLMI